MTLKTMCSALHYLENEIPGLTSLPSALLFGFLMGAAKESHLYIALILVMNLPTITMSH